MQFTRRTMSWLVAIALCALPAQAAAQQPDEKTQSREDVHQLAPPIHGPELMSRVEQARRKGFAFLVKSQNADGSWGSHDPDHGDLS